MQMIFLGNKNPAGIWPYRCHDAATGKLQRKNNCFYGRPAPSAAHIPLPYIMGYDMFPLTTLNEKKSFLSEAQQNNYVLFLSTTLILNAAAWK
jgi:hypothetical protein